MKGFFGKILHINLTDSRWHEELVDDRVYQHWLGGRGFGSYLLYRDLNPGVEVFSPENIIIFATGPATDTPMPGTSRYGVYSKALLTGFYDDSYAGGSLAPQMKKSGYDAILIQGAAKTPVFLEISNEGVIFHSASDAWGKDTYETENMLLSEVNIPFARAMVIDPAGEKLVRFATISNNYWRQAGRAGMGAVLGSKKVKGIVFHGNKKAEIADETALNSLARSLIEKGKTDAAALRYRNHGTPMVVGITNPAGAFPSEYWSKGSLDDWKKLSAETLISENDVKAKACSGCFFACGKLNTVAKGRHQGLKLEGPEYETIYSFGGLCKILDLGEIAYLNDICDRLGMDTISAGNLTSMCMELSKRGRISERIEYGNPGPCG